jgi:heparin binding hemagglutinin HbhA
MSITSDIRNYADTAVEQGKQIVGQAVETAQHQFADVTNRATGTVNDLRAQAEKTLNIDGLRTAIEPYLAQARQYRTTVTDRAEDLLGTVTSDPRVAKVVTTAETVTGLVIDTVQERIVKPVSSLTGRGVTPNKAAGTVTKPAKAATTRPAAKTTAKKAPAKKATPARKAPAKKTTSS